MAAPRRSSLRHQLLASPVPVFVVAGSGDVIAANEAALRLSARPAGALSGLRFSELFDLEGATPDASWSNGVPPPSMGPIRGRMRVSDQRFTEVELSTAADDGGAGEVACFVVPTHDEGVVRRHLTLAQRCAAEITSVKALPQVLETVVRLMVDAAGADHATITLRDQEAEAFVVQHEYPPSGEKSFVGERIPIRNHPVQQGIVTRRERVVVSDLAGHPILTESSKVAELVERLGIKSMAVFPMVCRNHVIGTISADSMSQTRTFSGDELEMFETVAKQAAIAIDNAKLLGQARTYEKLYSDAYSAFSLERVAAAILEGIRERIVCQTASVQMIVDGRRVLLASHGFDKARASPKLLGSIEHDPIVHEIVETRKLRVIADTSREPRWHAEETQNVRSWVGLPLVFGEKPLALVTVDHSEAGFYHSLANPEDPLRERLESFAQRAAVDLQEAFHFDAAQYHVRSVALIDRVAECVGRTLDTTTLLSDVTREIAQRMPCDRCVAFLLEGNGETRALVPKASWPAVPISELTALVVPTTIADAASPSLDALLRESPVVVNNFVDPLEARRYAVTSELSPGVQSAIAVPIVSSNRILGVLTASRSQANSFDQHSRALLETLARHTGVAVERNTGLTLVQNFGEQILKATGMKSVLEAIVSGAMRLTNTDSGVIFTLDDKGTAIVDRFAPPGSYHPAPRLAEEHGVTRRVIRDRDLVEIVDIADAPDVNPELKVRFRSMFAFPLILTVDHAASTDELRDRVVGVLYLNGHQPRGLSATERAFVKTLASQAAVVVQRTRLDAQVHESEAIYHSLVDQISQAVFRKDRESRFTSANKAFCDTLQLPISDVIGSTDSRFYPEAMAEGFVRDDQWVMANRRPLEKDESHHVIGQADRKTVHVVKTPVIDRGEVTGVQAIFWDVTEERAMQARYRALVEQSPDGIVVHKNRLVTMANPAALKLFGAASIEALRGRDIVSFVHPDDQALAEQWLDRISRQEPADPVEMRLVCRDRFIEVGVHARLLPGQAEVQVVFHDLTRVNTLLAEMHHRVRRALHVVASQLSDEEDDAADHSTLTRVFRALRSRINAISALHGLLQRQRGAGAVPMGDYLSLLTDNVRQCYQPRCPIQCGVSAGSLYLDEGMALRIGLMVAELVANSALHAFAGRPGGRIEVKLERNGTRHTLTVSDDGCGFVPSTNRGNGICGLRLVDELVQYDLKGRLDIGAGEPWGTVVKIEFDWTESAAQHG
jgi:PAS domain S-box-containing protein